MSCKGSGFYIRMGLVEQALLYHMHYTACVWYPLPWRYSKFYPKFSKIFRRGYGEKFWKIFGQNLEYLQGKGYHTHAV